AGRSVDCVLGGRARQEATDHVVRVDVDAALQQPAAVRPLDRVVLVHREPREVTELPDRRVGEVPGPSPGRFADLDAGARLVDRGLDAVREAPPERRQVAVDGALAADARALQGDRDIQRVTGQWYAH